MTIRLTIKTGIVLAGIVLLLSAGIAYALQIQRDDIEGSSLSGRSRRPKTPSCCTAR